MASKFKHQTTSTQESILEKKDERNQERLKNTKPPSTRRSIIVFDIDNTLCHSHAYFNDKKEQLYAKNHPECPLITWTEPTEPLSYPEEIGVLYGHVFLPYLQILFNYLVEQGARIVFFSSALKERNTTVIPELLTSFWGNEKYKTLKSEGQFVIFSKNNMREGTGGEEGNHVKDMKVVIQDGESILDAVLVDDDSSFCARDQKPCMRIIDLMWWYYHSDEIKDGICKPRYNFYKNGTYYMLGLFKSYFEYEKYKELPIREGIDQLVRTETDEFYCPEYKHSSYKKEHSFLLKMIGLGLSEVQKYVPNASMFKWREGL